LLSFYQERYKEGCSTATGLARRTQLNTQSQQTQEIYSFAEPTLDSKTPTSVNMSTFTKFFVLAAAVLATAVPTGNPSEYTCEADVDAQQSGAQCGNGQKLSCCNSGGGLLGLNCLSVPIRTFLTSACSLLSKALLIKCRDSWRADPEVLWLQCCHVLSDWRLDCTFLAQTFAPLLDTNTLAGKPDQHRTQLSYHRMIAPSREPSGRYPQHQSPIFILLFDGPTALYGIAT